MPLNDAFSKVTLCHALVDIARRDFRDVREGPRMFGDEAAKNKATQRDRKVVLAILLDDIIYLIKYFTPPFLSLLLRPDGENYLSDARFLTTSWSGTEKPWSRQSSSTFLRPLLAPAFVKGSRITDVYSGMWGADQ